MHVGSTALDLASMGVQAKFLAKRGVNLIRFMGNRCPSSPADINAVDPLLVAPTNVNGSTTART